MLGREEASTRYWRAILGRHEDMLVSGTAPRRLVCIMRKLLAEELLDRTDGHQTLLKWMFSRLAPLRVAKVAPEDVV